MITLPFYTMALRWVIVFFVFAAVVAEPLKDEILNDVPTGEDFGGEVEGEFEVEAQRIDSDKTKQKVTTDEVCSGPNQSLNPANQHCYEYIPGIITFDEAVTACKNLYSVVSAHLVDFEGGKAEEDFVTSFMLQKNPSMTSMWVGARRPPGGSRFDFQWIYSGQSINYSNWRYGQPYKGYPNADCAMTAKHNSWTWDDNPCTYHGSVACEYDIAFD